MFCFLKYRNEAGGYAEFRDLVGSWMAEDLDSCLYNTRGYVISQVSAMMFLGGSTNPRPKWFIRKLAAMGADYAQLRESLLLWMNSARLTDGHKRDAIESACGLIDTTCSHHRRLLDTNPRYFSAREALALTDREFSQRDGCDRDTVIEWKLRRQMFSATEPPLFSVLTERDHAGRSRDLSYAQLR
jgi:hypothetical protein